MITKNTPNPDKLEISADLERPLYRFRIVVLFAASPLTIATDNDYRETFELLITKSFSKVLPQIAQK